LQVTLKIRLQLKNGVSKQGSHTVNFIHQGKDALPEVPSPGKNLLTGLRCEVIQNHLDSQNGYQYSDSKDTSVQPKVASLDAEVEYGNVYLWKCMKC